MGGLFNFLARGVGLAFGAGTVRDAAARLGDETRPVLKQVVRAGLVAVDHLDTWTADARGQLKDLVAEARDEQRREDGRR